MPARSPFPDRLSGRRIPASDRPSWPPVMFTGRHAPADVIARDPGAVRADLQAHGAVLLRGTNEMSAGALRDVIASLGATPLVYTERSTPRRAVGETVYTSTEHPPDQHILPHHENAYASAWPRLLAFGCAVPAARGGQTPIYDGFRVYAALSPKTRDTLAQRGVRHLRTFGTELGLTAEETFGATGRAALEAKMDRAGLSYIWSGDGFLHTRYDTRPILKHPGSGQPVLFSHVAFFHQDNLPAEVRRDLLEVVGADHLPHAMRFADDTPIPSDLVADINQAYARCEVLIDWQPGDVALLDNMRVAHGRRPFTGERRILAALADEMQRSEAEFV